MKSVGKKLIKVAAENMIRRDMRKWPPDCVGFAYQPLRPEKKKNVTVQEK